MPSWDEIQTYHANRDAEIARRLEIDQLTVSVRAAAVSAEHLTGTAEWDRFLSWIQPLLDEAEGLCRQSQVDIFTGLTEPQRQKIMNTYWYYRGVADAYGKAMAIPAELLKKLS